jgi:hypothetical protein
MRVSRVFGGWLFAIALLELFEAAVLAWAGGYPLRNLFARDELQDKTSRVSETREV